MEIQEVMENANPHGKYKKSHGIAMSQVLTQLR